MITGSKSSLKQLISEITGINRDVFLAYDLDRFIIAERMSWVSKRETTRIEGKAYYLMGIFGINLPMLYGEGKNSFIKLQQEIMTRIVDHTIFAWTGSNFGSGFLAESHAAFQDSSDIARAKVNQVEVKLELNLDLDFGSNLASL